jgi:hypothetical protein
MQLKGENAMSEIQRKALREMAERGIGAMLVMGFGWVWPQTIRDNEQAARRVLDMLIKGEMA